MNFKNLIIILAFNLAQAQYKIAFIPFDDLSNYKGGWDLKVEVPRYLGDFVFKFYGVKILPIDSVFKAEEGMGINFKDTFLFSELNKRFGVEYVIGGKILTFNISRFMAGFPLTAGYETYNATVEFEAIIFNPLTGESSSIFGFFGEVKERGLGLTLLGKPTEKYSEFYSLDLLKFGSSEFNKTIIGEAMKKAGLEFALKLKKYIPEVFAEIPEIKIETTGETELSPVVVEGDIVFIKDQGNVYINLGSRDGIIPGMIVYVFKGDEKIGELEVNDVIDYHFSSCRVVKSSRELKKGDKVKIKVIK